MDKAKRDLMYRDSRKRSFVKRYLGNPDLSKLKSTKINLNSSTRELANCESANSAKRDSARLYEAKHVSAKRDLNSTRLTLAKRNSTKGGWVNLDSGGLAHV